MNEAFNKPYDPKVVEEKIYEKWKKSGYFNPDNLKDSEKGSFTIVLPPPNVTGTLHMGHALNATIQDILIRKKRMEGYKTLWIPGTDHAGIATQNVVEKQLKKEGISRHDLGREKFLEKVWEWKEKYGGIILSQLKKMGVSCDWSRTAFTMDPQYAEAVKKAFNQYYEKGWIYQGERVVNWCPRCGTSLSDLELEYVEEKTKLWHIKYPVKEGGFVIVATTRPETMLGDSAVAVNPKDERYKDFVGKTVILPIQDREIPIVADILIDKEFGTGTVKVTPAHDFTDAEIGQRHNLPIYKIIDEKGKMTATAGEFCVGLKITECREKVIEKLKELSLLEKEEDYTHSVAKCYRCNGTVEPLPSLQWFLKMSELAKLAIEAVESGKVKFHPQRWKKVYLDWLSKVKDWCISRQIWWGHKVPAWTCVSCGKTKLDSNIASRWLIVRHGESEWNKQRLTQGYLRDEENNLTDDGLLQAKNAGEIIKNYKIDLIISSDLKRCAQTADYISKATGVEIIYDKFLREKNQGVMEGIEREERDKKFGSKINDYEWKPENGESLKEVEERIWKVFNDHKINYRNKNIVIVSHGFVIKALLMRLKKLDSSFITSTRLKNTEITVLGFGNQCTCGNDIYEGSNDVLDTWFSSALWPFATLGWPFDKAQGKPSKKSDLEEFYPTQVLSTARDIINLWVARMVFSGMEFMGKAPFSDVIIHATILTKDGKRMSKSLGTGIDPMTLIEKYGADATRFGLIWQSMGGQDVHWAEEHVMAGKKFSNKLWNISRFVLTKVGDSHSELNEESLSKITDEESRKILEKLEQTKKSVSKDIDEYNFGQALHTLYDFIWHDFADVYLEYTKDKNSEEVNNTLYFTFYIILKTLHPFMPFVTEEIYQNLPQKDAEFLMINKW